MIFLALLAVAGTDRLDLICSGDGSANKTRSSTVQTYDGSGGSASVTGSSAEGFSDQVELWVEGDEGSIRVPRTMLPMFRGGKDGWFDLQEVVVTDTLIAAKAKLNIINKLQVRVDRRTGVLVLDGKSGHFYARCQRVDPTTRAF